MVRLKKKHLVFLGRVAESSFRLAPGLTKMTIAWFYDRRAGQGFYFPELNCIYVPIPKVATVSILRWFGEVLAERYGRESFLSREVSAHHLPFKRVDRGSMERLSSECLTFSVVRNPFERIASCYLNRVKEDSHYMGFLRYGNLFRKKLSFPDFLKEVYQIRDEASDQHFRSQSWYLTGPSGNLYTDRFFRLDRLADDFHVVQRHVGEEDRPLVNSRKPQGKYRYKSMYSEETKDLVRERYQKDFELLGYSMDF